MVTIQEILPKYVALAANNLGGYKAVTHKDIGDAVGLSAEAVPLKFGGDEHVHKGLRNYLKHLCRTSVQMLTEEQNKVVDQFIDNGEW